MAREHDHVARPPRGTEGIGDLADRDRIAAANGHLPHASLGEEADPFTIGRIERGERSVRARDQRGFGFIKASHA